MVREVSWLERKIKSKNIKPRETLIIDHMMHGATVNNSTRTTRNRQQTYHLTVPFFTSLMLRAVEERANRLLGANPVAKAKIERRAKQVVFILSGLRADGLCGVEG